jgi:hypothetical protein
MTTSRGMCGRVGPSRTNEREGKGYCVRKGGGEEGRWAKERASGVRLHSSCQHSSLSAARRLWPALEL